jgi:hypothetical protein
MKKTKEGEEWEGSLKACKLKLFEFACSLFFAHRHKRETSEQNSLFDLKNTMTMGARWGESFKFCSYQEILQHNSRRLRDSLDEFMHD